MTSRYETETNPETNPTRHREQTVPASSEAAYELLTSYRFTQRYVKRKVVAHIGWEEIGYGSRLLADTAESVVGLTNSPEAAEAASATHSARNVSYQIVGLPKLPYSESHFDAIVAFGVVEKLEHPEDLVREAKGILKKDGVLVISTLDKQAHANGGGHGGVDGRRRGMYVPEFRELLERHFRRVCVYRQGAVAGGFVAPASKEITSAAMESARFSLTSPVFDAELPTTRSIIAICSDVEDHRQEEQPYVLLDRDRRVFDECEERAEDVELMRSEIRRMQETEVQAFLDALRVQQSLYYILKRYPIHLRNIIRTIRTESRMYRRLSTPYRWLRAKNRNSD